MKRYQSAFAVPSGFAVSAVLSGAAARRGDALHRTAEVQGLASPATKARPIRKIRDRAA